MRGMAALGVLGLSVAGCKSFGVGARIDPPKVATYATAKCELSKGYRKAAGLGDGGKRKDKQRPIDLDCFRFPEQVGAKDAGSSGETAYQAAVGSELYRNRLVAVLVKHADDQCLRNNGLVVARQSAVNLIFDMLTTGLTAGATIVTGQQADSILTGVAAFTSGTRSHVSADIYRGQFTEAITAAIAGQRKELLDQINAKRAKTPTDYTVDEAIRDVNEYYQACSFYKGLEFVLKAAQGYPKLAEQQARDRALVEVRQLDTELDTLNAQYVKLAATDGAADLLPPLKQRIDAISAARAAQWAIAYPDKAAEPAAGAGEGGDAADNAVESQTQQ